MEIRPIEPADRDAVVTLADRLTEGVASWRDPDAVLRSVRGWVEGSVDGALGGRGDVAVIVADDDGDLAGFVSVTTKAHFTGQVDGYVGELVVSPSSEGRGVGRRLVAAASEWATERGARFLTLETGAANARALAFYSALGFVTEDVRLTLPLR